MKETIEDMSHQIFLDICGKEPMDIDIFFLSEIYFPKINYTPRMTVYLPIPREIQGNQTLQGNIFSNLEKSSITIFALYFASVCHAAGHAKLTDFKKYEKWIKGKNKERAYATFEFIEDIRVNNFLKNNFPEYHSEMKKIEQYFLGLIEKEEVKNMQKHSKKIFAERFIASIKKQRIEFQEQIINSDLEDTQNY